MYAFIYVHVCMNACACKHCLFMREREREWVSVWMCTCIWMCVCVYECAYVCQSNHINIFPPKQVTLSRQSKLHFPATADYCLIQTYALANIAIFQTYLQTDLGYMHTNMRIYTCIHTQIYIRSFHVVLHVCRHTCMYALLVSACVCMALREYVACTFQACTVTVRWVWLKRPSENILRAWKVHNTDVFIHVCMYIWRICLYVVIQVWRCPPECVVYAACQVGDAQKRWEGRGEDDKGVSRRPLTFDGH